MCCCSARRSPILVFPAAQTLCRIDMIQTLLHSSLIQSPSHVQVTLPFTSTGLIDGCRKARDYQNVRDYATKLDNERKKLDNEKKELNDDLKRKGQVCSCRSFFQICNLQLHTCCTL